MWIKKSFKPGWRRAWSSSLDEGKPGTHLWMKKNLEFTSGWRRAWKSPSDEQEPGSHPSMKENLELTVCEEKSRTHLWMKKSFKSGWRSTCDSSLDKGKPLESLELTCGWRKAWNLTLDEEELGNHLRMNKSLDLIPRLRKTWSSLWMKKSLELTSWWRRVSRRVKEEPGIPPWM